MGSKRCFRELPTCRRCARSASSSGSLHAGCRTDRGLLLETVEDLFRRLEQLNEVGAALSQERDIDHLLEKILLAAKAITRAAGGTLYVLEPSDEGPQLRFAIMRNEAMGIAMGGTTGNPIPFYPVHLYGKDGTPNNQMVAAYTAGHCQRVPVLTMMLAEAVNETNEGPLRDFNMSDKDRYELKIAGLLHDCGKVTTPVHVVDKATKLETIFDRIN